MRTDLIVLGIIGIIAVNLIVFFIVRNRAVDKGLRNYLKKNYRE